jgi:hypothetical protein
MRSMFGARRGKAPRGYQRSDERLREMICERLMEDGRVDASDVEIAVKDGCVKLDGSVDSRMAKYQIEDMIESFGVSDVQNNLRVSRDRDDATSSAMGGTSQYGSSGGASSLGMSGSGTTGDRTTGTSGGLPTASGTSGGSSTSKDRTRER